MEKRILIRGWILARILKVDEDYLKVLADSGIVSKISDDKYDIEKSLESYLHNLPERDLQDNNI